MVWTPSSYLTLSRFLPHPGSSQLIGIFIYFRQAVDSCVDNWELIKFVNERNEADKMVVPSKWVEVVDDIIWMYNPPAAARNATELLDACATPVKGNVEDGGWRRFVGIKRIMRGDRETCDGYEFSTGDEIPATASIVNSTSMPCHPKSSEQVQFCPEPHQVT